MKKATFLLILLLGLSLFSCMRPKPQSEDRILTAAKECAKRDGYKLEYFSVEVDRSDPEKTVVFFTGKRTAPGNHFSVYVDKESFVCRLIPGR